MILVQTTVERMRETYVEHQLVDTEEQVEEIRREHRATEKDLYSTPGSVGYYSFFVEILELENVLVSDLKLTIPDFARLMNYVNATK